MGNFQIKQFYLDDLLFASPIAGLYKITFQCSRNSRQLVFCHYQQLTGLSITEKKIVFDINFDFFLSDFERNLEISVFY